MKKEELEQYRSIIAELNEINDKINSNTLHSTVTGSDNKFPYTKHCMSVSGTTAKYMDDIALKQKLEQQRDAIELFVENIPDSETRRIFRYRYIVGKKRPSWQYIAFKIGHYDEQHPRKKHNDFLKKYEKYEKSML